MEIGIIKYDITEAAIKNMENLYMGLVITDLNDKEQFDSVHSARMVVKNKRIEIEKKRKELKADALAWGKKVDAEAKKIFLKIEPIESHLIAEEDKVLKEQKKIKDEKEREKNEMIETRINALLKFGVVLSFENVANMPDDEFVSQLAQAKESHEAEQKRIAEHEAQLEKTRKEQEAKEIELKAAQEKIEAENRKIEIEKKKKEAKEIEKAKEERLERLKPDKEQIEIWLNRFSVPSPPTCISNKESEMVIDNILKIFDQAMEAANQMVKNL